MSIFSDQPDTVLWRSVRGRHIRAVGRTIESLGAVYAPSEEARVTQLTIGDT